MNDLNNNNFDTIVDQVSTFDGKQAEDFLEW